MILSNGKNLVPRGRAGGGACHGCQEVGLRGLGDSEDQLATLRTLGQLYRGGELAGLGDLDATGMLTLSRTDIHRETETHDATINTFLLELGRSSNRVPPAFIAAVDAYVFRWRKFKNEWWFVGTTRRDEVLAYQAEFNRLRDQFVKYGQSTVTRPATVTFDGTANVRADALPKPPPGFFDRAEKLGLYAAVIVGGLATFKITQELGVFTAIGAKVRRLVK
jgi:hypothetical protein